MTFLQCLELSLALLFCVSALFVWIAWLVMGLMEEHPKISWILLFLTVWLVPAVSAYLAAYFRHK